MYDEFYTKVLKIAEVQYDISIEVLESFTYEIENCYGHNYSPRRTVEVIVQHIFN